MKDFEKVIAQSQSAKTNPKAFYAYAKSKLKTRESVADLTDKSGRKATSDAGKAEMLNEFFSSVFTKENTGFVPDCDRRQLSNEMQDIVINTSEVLKLLKNLDMSKSAGPDNICIQEC